jgi:hypothetical protein
MALTTMAWAGILLLFISYRNNFFICTPLVLTEMYEPGFHFALASPAASHTFSVVQRSARRSRSERGFHIPLCNGYARVIVLSV